MIVSVRGIEMHALVAGAGPALLLLHGFTGSAETWRPFLPELAACRRVIAPDLIGHGRTAAPADAARYRMDECVADLLALLDRLGVGEFAVLGYSMGGRVALHLALAVPERVRALILESASPGITNPAERAERARSDEALAGFIEREGIAAFVERWESQPLFASQRSLPAEVWARLRAERLGQRPRGLANSLRGMGAGAMAPVWNRLGELGVPVLVLAGELDAKYVAIARTVGERLPRARVAIVPGAGHAVHLEQPAQFLELVTAFLGLGGEGGARS